MRWCRAGASAWRRRWRGRLNAQDDTVRIVNNSEIGSANIDRRALGEGAGDPAGALNDGELLSDRGIEAVNERTVQGSYTSPKINGPSNLQPIIFGAGSHAADFDLESRSRVKGHVAGGSQNGGAVPWRHGSIGRGDTADGTGAAKRSTGNNTHQTAGSAAVYQQGPGADRRGAGVGI